ncbi:hypothetical protein BDZ45DRAFT_750571 [Acephala macrosclerotiorum]|nr:hypothetical protein BDZ45DRAFT_750571 [Acephala macrosclerotiorum]
MESRASWRANGEDVDVELLIQAGTNLLAGKAAAELEEELGKPVVTINTATVWHAYRSNGIMDKVEGWGSLLICLIILGGFGSVFHPLSRFGPGASPSDQTCEKLIPASHEARVAIGLSDPFSLRLQAAETFSDCRISANDSFGGSIALDIAIQINHILAPNHQLHDFSPRPHNGFSRTPSHHEPSKHQFSLAIIGSGIGGLALAIGLLAQNVPCTIYEAAPKFDAVSAGIGLGPNVLKAMELMDPKFARLCDEVKVGDRSPARQHKQIEILSVEEGFGSK